MSKKSLSQQQWEFLQDVALLILEAKRLGFKLTGGELKRPKPMQYLYVYGKTLKLIGKILSIVSHAKLSKTMKSDHLYSLAIDFNIFYDVDGDGDKDYNPGKEISRLLGEFWKGLNPLNYWGGDWGWDAPHFGRRRV